MLSVELQDEGLSTCVAVGDRVSLVYEDCFGRRTEILESVVDEVQDMSDSFPCASDVVLGIMLRDRIPSTHYPAPREDIAYCVFLYIDSKVSVFIDENGQPRHVDLVFL